MAFYKVRKKKNGLYYPESVTTGKRITTKQLADTLSDRCTVTRADTLAVLTDLGKVMSIYMAAGNSVKLDGLGSFRYTINASKNGVETPEKVDATNINGVRVRFTPETTRNSDKTIATRSMQAYNVEWIDIEKLNETKKSTTEDDESEGEDGNVNENGGGATGGNPL
jgi:predicted histone-like DNA-binding protein